MARTPKKARKFNKLSAKLDRKITAKDKVLVNAGGPWGDYTPSNIPTYQKKVNKRPKKGKVSGSGFTEVREGDGRSDFSDFNVVTRVLKDPQRWHAIGRADALENGLDKLADKHNDQFEKLSRTQFASYLKPNLNAEYMGKRGR